VTATGPRLWAGLRVPDQRPDTGAIERYFSCCLPGGRGDRVASGSGPDPSMDRNCLDPLERASILTRNRPIFFRISCRTSPGGNLRASSNNFASISSRSSYISLSEDFSVRETKRSACSYDCLVWAYASGHCKPLRDHFAVKRKPTSGCGDGELCSRKVS
jgi:hypothetical protein